eukprot:1565678-Pyramimonas_sp.AAC.1
MSSFLQSFSTRTAKLTRARSAGRGGRLPPAGTQWVHGRPICMHQKRRWAIQAKTALRTPGCVRS